MSRYPNPNLRLDAVPDSVPGVERAWKQPGTGIGYWCGLCPGTLTLTQYWTWYQTQHRARKGRRCRRAPLLPVKEHQEGPSKSRLQTSARRCGRFSSLLQQHAPPGFQIHMGTPGFKARDV
ncbi:hypothetical protein FQA47_008397 [Oryzias melastigma]|uniref:Uncharacterized protein n=1 Tax=Oryzias melastigma TaxID=30732 RepID=A0A834FFB9_ORYME|nr:hypothetical protein FQA47_008397 [Oryzias melastigma]